MKQRTCLLIVFLFISSISANAQGTPGILHCSSNVGVNLNASRAPDSPIIARIKCGDTILMIDQRFGSPHVRTEDGKEGYIIGLNLGQWSFEPEASPVGASAQNTTATANAAPPRSAALLPGAGSARRSEGFRFDEAQYFAQAPGKERVEPIKGTVILDPLAKELRFETKGISQFEVRYEAITSMLYERAAKPRYGAGLLVAWPLLFTKSKKHFFTVQYKGTDGSGQFAVIQLDKSNYQLALAATETQTGKKIDRTEER